MSGEYKGFRIWNLEFQVMTPGASNVVDDGNGRMHNSVTNAIYWDETDDGLRSHLLDFLAPMYNGTNSVGWELDDEVYTKLYNIVNANDPIYSDFISRNQNIYDSKNNPSGDKTIKLAPTEYVRVMCFKHELGYRAMIGLSLYAMDTFNKTTQFISNTSYSIKLEPGFNKYHVYRNDPNASVSSSYGLSIGGLFMSMIPPENESDTPANIWHLEENVYDEKFFVPEMTPIVPMIHSTHYYNGSGSYSNMYYTGCSWLKRGTSTQYSSSNAGMLNSTNCKLSLMLDEKATIWLSYKYVSDQNTKYINPMIILGPIYKKKIYSDDTLCTRNLGVLCQAITGNSETYYNNRSKSTSASQQYNSAWCTGSSYYEYFYSAVNYSTSGCAYFSVGTFTPDGSAFDVCSIYTAYPACPSDIYTNFRYAKAGYTQQGLLDEETFRWVKSDGLVKGQTYNDNQWVYLGSSYNFYANDGTGNSNSYLYPSIKWDGEFNGTKTFA